MNSLNIEAAMENGVVVFNKEELCYTCCWCKRDMTGEIPLTEHLYNKKHKANGFRYTICHIGDVSPCLKRLLPPEVRSAAEAGILVAKDSPASPIRCTVCDMTFTGLQPVIHHLAGDEHRKHLKLSSSFDLSMSSASGSSSSYQGSRTNHVLANPAHQISRTNHDLANPSHQRNQQIADALEDGVVIFDNQNSCYDCSLCDKYKMGEVLLAQHLNNSKHKDADFKYIIGHIRDVSSSRKQRLPPEVRIAADEGVIYRDDEPDSPIICTVCKRTLTGLKPAIEHLSGGNHRKQLHRRQTNLPSALSRNGAPGSNSTQEFGKKNHVLASQSPESEVRPTGLGTQLEAWQELSPSGHTAINARSMQTVYQNQQFQNLHRESSGAIPRSSVTHSRVELVRHPSPREPADPVAYSGVNHSRMELARHDSQEEPADTVAYKGVNHSRMELARHDSQEEPADTAAYSGVNHSRMDFARLPSPTTSVDPVRINNKTVFLPVQTHSNSINVGQANGLERSDLRPTSRHIPPVTGPTWSLTPLDNSSNLIKQATEDQFLAYESETGKFWCQICKLRVIADQESVETHLKNKVHLEKIVTFLLRISTEQLGERPLSGQQLPQSQLGQLPQEIAEAVVTRVIKVKEKEFHCSACNVSSNGFNPLQQHLEGNGHLRKMALSQMGGSCPGQQQLQEGRPRNEVPRGDDIDVLAEAFQKGVVVCTDSKSGDEMKCIICNTTLNGSKNLEQHLNGTKHWKQMKRLKDSEAVAVQSPATADESPRNSTGSIPEEREEELPYSVESTPRGHVHIFNYIFKNRKENPKEREGATTDTERLMNTFSGMGYKVFCHLDLTFEGTENMLEQIRQNEELGKVDVLVMFFLSHGNHPYKFYTADVKQFDLQDIKYKFTDSNCPSMKKKPKIIFTNYCRGVHDELPEADAMQVDIPRDMVTIHASTEGITALRNKKRGTHFVRSLCIVLEQCAKSSDLRDIYLKIDIKSKEMKGRQPNWEDNRFKKFYFNPINW